MTMTFEQDEAEFGGTNGLVVGRAVYDCTIERDFSADIGGSDGLVCSNVELLRVEIDGLHLNRDQIALVCGESVVARDEDVVMEVINTNPEDYMEGYEE
jgi:hypothetical protein